VRAFTGESVAEEILAAIAEAGLAAPSAVNSRTWAIVLVRDRARLDRLCDALPFAKMLSKAAAALVVCGLPNIDDDVAPRFWTVNCAAMTENILLAAHSFGLGAVWTAVHPSPDLVRVVREILAIPEHAVPFNVIPVGVPAQLPAPREPVRLEDFVHQDVW
jgi:nitroreductase